MTEDELHAYVDGELPRDRSIAVEEWLASHPDDASRVATWRLQADAIRARFNNTANEAIPSRLKIEALLRSGRNWRTIAAALAALAFLVGGVAGWMARSTTEVVAAIGDPADDLAQRALAAHKLYIGEIRHPVEVGASEAHLTPWLSRRLGTTLRLPDFSAFDLKLMGGRLLPGNSDPAALLMYENSAGDRITFYISKLQQPQMAFRYYTSDNVAAIRWVVSDYGYVVAGPADKMKLKELARAAFEQLENRAPPPHPSRSSAEPVVSRHGG
ncbi:anti-sigma factor family protein [Pseudorhodoplanes sp.]|uniref:anti-sigma factor family protein n=1 Tax=Pseudorhodoplanes sp. TaxID=1934341 RepID=UPI003D09C5C2